MFTFIHSYIILNENETAVCWQRKIQNGLLFAADWLRTKGFTTGGPRCAYPSHLQDRPIHALPTHEFRCTGNVIHNT